MYVKLNISSKIHENLQMIKRLNETKEGKEDSLNE